MWKNICILLTILPLSMSTDYYELLGLTRDVEVREIRKAFKRLAVTQHPDKNSDDPEAHEKFIRLTTAYEVLKDPELRKKYDLFGEEGLNDSNKQRSYHSWHYYHDNFGIYDDDPEVITLTYHDYYENVLNSEKMWLINFYSPMCSHCHDLAPTWRKIAKELEGVIKIGAVNCEDDWHLCHQIGIQSYPTILHHPPYSRHGVRYTSEKTYSSILRFVMDRLDVDIEEIKGSLWTQLFNKKILNGKPTLVFTCNSDNCFSSYDKLKIAAIFDKMMNVRTFECSKNKCDRIPRDTEAVYFPVDENEDPVILKGLHDTNDLIQKILEQLPEPQDLSDEDFKKIDESLKRVSTQDSGWLICFYIGHMTELNILLKRLSSIVDGSTNLGKINCGKYADLCRSLNVNRYPMWGVMKPGGAYEFHHGKHNLNEIAKFAESIQARNLWALSADEVLSILQRKNGDGAWFLDWYAPWCPPCMQFLPEVRKASLELDASVVRFGTVDCTIHAQICRDYNIRSYPTAMLINGTNTYQFMQQKNAANVVNFIKEIVNSPVVRLTSDTFNRRLPTKKSKIMWIIDYFAPWCAPCQQFALEWIQVAKTLSELSYIKIASVDCEKETALCTSQGIKKYPTVRLYPLGSEGLSTIVLYNGQKDSLSVLRWIIEFLPVKVTELDPDSMVKRVLNSRDVWIVDYFAPWCDHCHKLEPHFAIAAQLLDKKVRFGRVNCDIYRSLCASVKVRAFPTMLVYSTNHKQRRIDEGFRINALGAKDIKERILDYVGNHVHHDEL